MAKQLIVFRLPSQSHDLSPIDRVLLSDTYLAFCWEPVHRDYSLDVNIFNVRLKDNTQTLLFQSQCAGEQRQNNENKYKAICFSNFFVPLYCFLDTIAEEMTGNRMREGGSHRQQRAPGQDSNPGPLQRGQSLCTQDACSTNWAKYVNMHVNMFFNAFAFARVKKRKKVKEVPQSNTTLSYLKV